MRVPPSRSIFSVRLKAHPVSKVPDDEHGYESTVRAIDSSLANFGFDYLDLYLIHSPLSGKTKRLETWRALVDAKKAGKLRTIGVSN